MDNQVIFCLSDGCKNKIKNHRWGKTKAEGWFFSKDGSAYCPDHNPEWVVAWRGKTNG